MVTSSKELEIFVAGNLRHKPRAQVASEKVIAMQMVVLRCTTHVLILSLNTRDTKFVYLTELFFNNILI